MMCQGAYVGVVQLAEEFDFVLELFEFGVLHLGLIESLDGHIDAAPEPSAERSGFMLALPYGDMSRQLARARVDQTCGLRQSCLGPAAPRSRGRRSRCASRPTAWYNQNAGKQQQINIALLRPTAQK
jgi:hypothetical protein